MPAISWNAPVAVPTGQAVRRELGGGDEWGGPLPMRPFGPRLDWSTVSPPESALGNGKFQDAVEAEIGDREHA
jgi:hypothetical protein